jgi:hypothetical protein
MSLKSSSVASRCASFPLAVWTRRSEALSGHHAYPFHELAVNAQ